MHGLGSDPTAKRMLVLALNAGSSSLKAALFFLAEEVFAERNSPGRGSARGVDESLTLLAHASVSEIGSKRASKAKLASYSPPHSFLVSCGVEGGNVESGVRLTSSLEPKIFSDFDAGPLVDHESALQEVLQLLFNHAESTLGPFAELTPQSVTHVTHRIVHGGSLFTSPIELTADRIGKLHNLTALAPLHNAPAERVVRLAHSSLSHAKHFAFFDTCFHVSLPEEVYTYPLPLEECRKRNIRKFGFHGLSYSFVTKRVERHLRQTKFRANRCHDYKLVILHLGSGASACAVRGGKSVETSMGYTPVDGLMMATRPGTVDPTAVLHLFDDPRRATELVSPSGISNETNSGGSSNAKEVPLAPLTRMEDLLNHGCGFKGIAGSSVIEEVAQMAKKEREHNGGGGVPPKSSEALAVAMFIHRLRLVIGGYAATLGGMDALVFTGGSGTKWVDGREMVCQGLGFLGIRLDEKKNRKEKVGEEAGIVWDVTESDDSGAVRILVIETDEEREMAEGVLEL